MPFLLKLLLALAAIAACFNFAPHALRRFRAWREGRAVKDVLSEWLDATIARLADPDDAPLRDLVSWNTPSDLRPLKRWHAMHFPDGGGRVVTVLMDHSNRRPDYCVWIDHPALSKRHFPSCIGDCRSPWFTQRLEKLFRLLETYPSERLLSARAHLFVRRALTPPA